MFVTFQILKFVCRVDLFFRSIFVRDKIVWFWSSNAVTCRQNPVGTFYTPYADCQLCSFGNTTHSRLDVGHFGMDCSPAVITLFHILSIGVCFSKEFIVFPFQSQVVFVFFNFYLELCLVCVALAVCVCENVPSFVTSSTPVWSMRFSMVRPAKLAALLPFFRVHPWRPDVPTPTRIRTKNWSSGREGFG